MASRLEDLFVSYKNLGNEHAQQVSNPIGSFGWDRVKLIIPEVQQRLVQESSSLPAFQELLQAVLQLQSSDLTQTLTLTLTQISTNLNLSGWDLEKSLQHLRNNAGKSKGLCAAYVYNALRAGGLKGKRANAVDVVDHNIMESYGFRRIASFKSSSPDPNYKPQAGDVIATSRNGSNAVKGHHLAMYDGTHWISDFKQNSFNVYRAKDNEWVVYRRVSDSPTKQTSGNNQNDNVIRINKTNRTLSVNGLTFKVSISKKGTDLTTKSGDNLTPEGTFGLGNRKSMKGFNDNVYGYRPNAYGGRFYALTGGITNGRGFGIHGSDEYNDPGKYQVGKFGTHGCIAMKNDDLAKLEQIMDAAGGPSKFKVLITKNLKGGILKASEGTKIEELASYFSGVKSSSAPSQTISNPFLNFNWAPIRRSSPVRVVQLQQSSEQLPQFSNQSQLLPQQAQLQLSLSQPATSSGPTVTLAGYEVPKSFLNLGWKQEAGTNYGELSERARKGIVVLDNHGKPDNKRGAKTYGAGLLYHPETGKYMQDMEPAGGFTTQELTRLYDVLVEKLLTKARLVGCKTWNQAGAYSGIVGNFGPNAAVTKKLELMIREGKSDDEIANFIMHASDSQRRLFPGLITRRMWEARLWKGDFDPGGSHSAENRQITKQLNPG